MYPCVQTSCWIKLRIHTSHYSECFFGTWLWMSHWLTQISLVCLVIVAVLRWFSGMIGNKQFLFDVSTVFIHYTTPIFLKAITSLKKEAATCFSLKPKIWTHGHSQCPESPGSNLPVRQDVAIKNIQFWLVYVLAWNIALLCFKLKYTLNSSMFFWIVNSLWEISIYHL